jgi:hypothetical protein
MDQSINLRQLLTNAHTVVLGAQRSFSEPEVRREELLNIYWTLRDDVIRIVESAADDPNECADLLQGEFSFLMRGVIDLLQKTRTSPLAKVAAISRACAEVNESLWRLKMLTEDRQFAAGAK